MKKKRLLTRYDRLITFVRRKAVDIVKDKFMSFLETDKDSSKNYAERNWKNKAKQLQIKCKAIREIKARTNWDDRKITESQEDYYKRWRVGNFWSIIYIKYESISNKNKTLSAKER